MNIYLTRHGQTNLNKARLMQGQIEEPLNDTGRQQAREASMTVKDIKFDAVYSSPLERALETASVIGNLPVSEIIIDERLTEVSFGKFERVSYYKLGLRMTLYWMFPEIFKCPDTVESIASMVKRSSSFLEELQSKNYENVLIVCHGGIIRALSGCLENRKNGIKWRPKPKNCEIRKYVK